MIRKILNKIRTTIGTRRTAQSIFDFVKYEPLASSFSGGSLSDSNLLCVINRMEDGDVVRKYFIQEKCRVETILLDKALMTIEAITKAGDSLLGPFDHIVNIIHIDKENHLFSEDSSYNDDDAMRMLYQWLQTESDYLLKVMSCPTLCSILIKDDSIDAEIMGNSANICMVGLAKVLGNHGIIVNGIIAEKNTPLEDILKASAYLSGKYGQILAGEVLKIKK